MSITNSSIVIVTPADRFFLLKLVKNDQDILFIRSLGQVRWDSTAFCWVIPSGDQISERLTSYFGNRLQWAVVHNMESKAFKEGDLPEEGTLKVIKSQNGRIKLVFPFSPTLVQVIKQHPFYSWNAKEKFWTLPDTEKINDILANFCKEVNWIFLVKEEDEYIVRKPRRQIKETRDRLECPGEYLDKLRMMRYSEKTISVYKSCFTEFINYYPDKKIGEITYDEINAYQLYLVDSRHVSISYQNQAINSIKFYLEKILKGKRETYYIERPRQEKTLPTVLSVEEVKAIINVIDNLKHKCAIMTTYSAGLRIGELLNLKVGDIDSKRMLIIVRQGKGKKDRVTLLSTTLLQILREYFIKYHPKEYLFEGENGGRYAERSIQNVLARAVEGARITKHVTMHTLRHSFATHMLEQNTDIRYIKELLGHTNLKTTLIYTHITTKGLDQLKSPLDNLGL